MPGALTTPLRIGTDCSGMETPVMALQELGVAYEHKFSCDIDRNVKKQILQNFPPAVWYDDLMTRDNRAPSTPAVDLYVAGFPCQPFSAAGLKKGFADKRGMVFYGVADYIDCKRPRAFVLENVKRLVGHDQGRTFEEVRRSLQSIGDGAYDIKWQCLNTQDHGVPQSRPRVYIVGIRRDCRQREFEFPGELPPVDLDSVLDPVVKRPTMGMLPPESNGTAHGNVKEVLARLQAAGKSPLKNTYVIDLDASPRFRVVMENRAMCMTKARASGYWLTSRGRRMNVDEMLRCQGMRRCFKQVVSDRLLGGQIGNAMSQNILERLFVSLLPAAGLVQQDVRLHDRWATATRKRRAMAPFGAAPASKRARAA